MRFGTLLATMLAAGVLMASPVMAKKTHHSVPCSKIKDAIAAGKSEEDVAKDLKTTTAHVKACTNPAPAKKHKAGKA